MENEVCYALAKDKTTLTQEKKLMLSIDIHYCFSKVLPEYYTQISKPTFRLPLTVAVGY